MDKEVFEICKNDGNTEMKDFMGVTFSKETLKFAKMVVKNTTHCPTAFCNDCISQTFNIPCGYKNGEKSDLEIWARRFLRAYQLQKMAAILDEI